MDVFLSGVVLVAVTCLLHSASQKQMLGKQTEGGGPPPQLPSVDASTTLPQIGAPWDENDTRPFVWAIDESGEEYLKCPSEGVYSSAAGFRYPFLGVVRIQAKTEKVSIPRGSGAPPGSQALRVYRNESGELVRAEYAKVGEFTWDWAPESLVSGYKMCCESFSRMPPGVQVLSLQQIVHRLNEVIPLGGARQWSITAIQRDTSADESKQVLANVYEASIFGVITAGGKIPSGERFKRLRVILNLKGEVIAWDNML